MPNPQKVAQTKKNNNHLGIMEIFLIFLDSSELTNYQNEFQNEIRFEKILRKS